MTLERIEHKVFASEAPLDEMGQFGSALATTKLNTKDVAEIQALPAYTKGWGSAIISENNYPAMEEMNGVLNVMSYHTGYLYQEGIPTYSATQEYSVTSWVKDLAGKNIYKSKKNNNIGNNLNDSEWFERVDFSENSLKNNQITNCITEIPQRIKLELNNGTLTLKAGSKVIAPNGFEADGTTPKFDEVVIESDLTTTGVSYSNPCFIMYDHISKAISVRDITQCQSGTSTPTSAISGVYIYYNTSENKIYLYSNGAWTARAIALPLCIVNMQTATPYITSVDQVFNGFGYIGSTVWVDKGVKGLVSNGRNADGTLNNIEARTETVLTHTNKNAVQKWFSFKTPTNGVWTGIDYIAHDSLASGDWLYNEQNNTWSFRGNIQPWFPFADSTLGSSSPYAIASFQPKLPFRAVDWNDLTELNNEISSKVNSLIPNNKSTIGYYALPSTKYTDLTLGASGSTYTAPANGYYYLWKITGAIDNAYMYMHTDTHGVGCCANTNDGGHTLLLLPVTKGNVVTVVYGTKGATNCFRFIYAQGEV